MSQQEKITTDMMENLQYDKVDKSTTVNNLKSTKNYFESAVKLVSNENIADFVKAIKQNIKKLAIIEEGDNCVPRKVAERNIELALKECDVYSDRIASPDCKIILATWDKPLFHFIRDLVAGLKSHKEVKIIYDHPRITFIDQLGVELNKPLSRSVTLEDDCTFVDTGDMFIMESSDLNAASHYLVKSIHDYIGCPWKWRSVYVQESCMNKFVAKIAEKLGPYPSEVLRDKLFQECYQKSYDRIKELNARTLRVQKENSYVPLICFEFDKNYFNDCLQLVTSIRSFRTTKDVINLAQKSPLSHSTIWSSNISVAYEIVSKVDRGIFWINCSDIWGNLWNRINDTPSRSAASIEDSYHFEYFSSEGRTKNVVFPIGGIFAN